MSRVGLGNLSTFSILRLVACFGVVWTHMWAYHWSVNFGYAVMTIFLALSFYGTPSRLHWHTFANILTPWLFWCLFYKVLEAARARDPWQLVTVADPTTLFVGPMIHLWYLPYLALGTLVFATLARYVTGRRAFIVACVVGLIPMWTGMWLHGAVGFYQPLSQFSGAVAVSILGFLVGRGRTYDLDWLPVVLFVATCIGFWLNGYLDWPPYAIAGALIFYGAAHFKTSVPYAKQLGVLSFGIYLVHPFFMLVWYHSFAGAEVADGLGVVAVFLASAAATYAMRQVPLLKQVV